MSLAVQPLSGFPAVNTAFVSGFLPNQIVPGAPGSSSTPGTPTIAAPYSYSTSTTFPNVGKKVYTPGSTTYIFGIIDAAGVVPARLFTANNGTGSYAGAAQSLPQLSYIIQNQVTASDGSTGYGGYTVVLTPAEPGRDAGTPSSPIVTKEGNATASAGTSSYPQEPVLVQVPGYGTSTPSGVYPQPQMVFYVSMDAILITSTTAD
jgi:hypothetical protein